MTIQSWFTFIFLPFIEKMCERERERERGRQTDRQTDRQRQEAEATEREREGRTEGDFVDNHFVHYMWRLELAK